ncbi:hypothetical protein [Mycobacterium sp. MAA66]
MRLVDTLNAIADTLAEQIDEAHGAEPADVSGSLPDYLMDLPAFDVLIGP